MHNPSLHIQQKQLQRMAPQVMQSIQIMTMPLISLLPFLSKITLDNPLVDINYCNENMTSLDELLLRVEWSHDDSERGQHKGTKANGQDSPTSHNLENMLKAPRWENSLATHLRIQVKERKLYPQERDLVYQLIDELDRRGYYDRDLQVVADELGKPLSLVRSALSIIQTLEPKGVGAQNLPECLCLQLPRNHPLCVLAKQMLTNDFDAFAAYRRTYLCRKYRLADAQLRQVYALVRTTNPSPAASFVQDDYDFLPIYPDVIIEKVDDVLKVHLANYAHRLVTINHQYEHILHKQDAGGDEKRYVREKLQEAERLAACLQLRDNAVEKVALCIATLQGAFFFEGPAALKPLTMQRIADAIEMNVSTVCRVMQDKYVQTQHGTFPLNHFVSSSLQTVSNKAVSSTVVREKIRDIIAHENPLKPLSDQKITQMLLDCGIVVSRRTVAKYRDLAGIPVQRKRAYA